MTFYIETYGCQMNVSDSDNIRLLLVNHGYTECNDEKEADIVILVTCAVRQSAEDRITGRLGYYKSIKEKNNLILIIVGCIAQEKGKTLLTESSVIDLVIGTQSLHGIPQYIQQFILDKKPQVYDSASYVFLPEAL